jgi:hypothetical protein
MNQLLRLIILSDFHMLPDVSYAAKQWPDVSAQVTTDYAA